RTLALVLMTWSLLVFASSASAQLVAAKDGPVVYGHHHLNVTSVEPQKKFFVDALGGTAIKIGTNNLEIVKFPGVLIFYTQRAPPVAPSARRPITSGSPCRISEPP